MLHRLDPAAAQTRAVVRVEGRPPGRLEELRVVGVATVDLDEERLAAGVRPPRDEDAGRLPVGRLEADDLDPELVERRDHVVGLGVPGRRAGGEPDDGRRDDRDEQRGDRPARRRGFDEDRAEEAEHEHPADEPLERADEVGDDGEDDRRGERDAEDGKRRGVDVEPHEIVELGPAARREPRRADRDRGGQDDRCERLEQDGGATADERQRERARPRAGRGCRRGSPRRARASPAGSRASGRASARRPTGEDGDEDPEPEERRDEQEDVGRAAVAATAARGGEDPRGQVPRRCGAGAHRASLRGCTAGFAALPRGGRPTLRRDGRGTRPRGAVLRGARGAVAPGDRPEPRAGRAHGDRRLLPRPPLAARCRHRVSRPLLTRAADDRSRDSSWVSCSRTTRVATRSSTRS